MSTEVPRTHPVGRAAPSGEPGSLRRVPGRVLGRVLGQGALGQGALVVGVLVLAGVLGGLVWAWLWDAPTGVVSERRWVQDEEGLRGDFSGTGTYVAVATLAGLLAGGVVSAVFRRHELVTLVALVLGSVLSGWLMYVVGVALAPADPVALARSAPDGTRLPGTLVVTGASPFVALPVGALVALVVVFFGLGRPGRKRSPRVGTEAPKGPPAGPDPG